MQKKVDISIVVPVYNEEGNIVTFVNRVKNSIILNSISING